MPTGENFGTNVPTTNTTAPVPSGNPTVPVNSTSGWPTIPFTAILGIGTSLQEAIYVNSAVGTTWTVTRGYDGTTQQNHPVGQTVTHGTVGVHFREPRSHIDASTSPDASGHSIHGLTGGSAVVGTLDAQTLSNKVLAAPAITGVATISGTLNGMTVPSVTDTVVGKATTDTLTNKTISAGTFTGTQAMGSGNWNGTGAMVEASFTANGKTGATGSTIALAGTFAGGPPVSGTFAGGDIVFDTTNGGLWVCVNSGTPGTWRPAGDRMLLGSTSPSGVASTTFSSIPAYFKHLTVEYVARTSNAGGNGLDNILIQLNGISSATYSYELYGWQQGGAAFNNAANAQTSAACGWVWSSHVATVGAGRGTIELPFYSETTFMKGGIWQTHVGDGSAVGLTANGGFTASAITGAVTSITINTTSGNFLAGSTFNLYASL